MCWDDEVLKWLFKVGVRNAVKTGIRLNKGDSNVGVERILNIEIDVHQIVDECMQENVDVDMGYQVRAGPSQRSF